MPAIAALLRASERDVERIIALTRLGRGCEEVVVLNTDTGLVENDGGARRRLHAILRGARHLHGRTVQPLLLFDVGMTLSSSLFSRERLEPRPRRARTVETVVNEVDGLHQV